MIERGSGLTVWRQIAHELQGRIARGQMVTGDRLPTEMALADEFQVNRHTVRRAIAALAEDGYVAAERGRGTFVARQPITYPLTGRTRFSEIVSAQQLQPGGRLIASSYEPASTALAEKLGLNAGQEVVRLETLRVVDRQPVVLSTIWFDPRRVPHIISDYAETGSITQALERGGISDYRRKSSWITAAMATPTEAGFLQVDAGTPLLIVDSLNVARDGEPLQFSRARFISEGVQLLVES